MSIVTVNDDNLFSIANAIREKNGSFNVYTPAQMSSAISNIPWYTQYNTGSIIGTGQLLNTISIDVGFVPNVFLLLVSGACYSNNTEAPFTLTSAFLLNGSLAGSTIPYTGCSFVLKGSSTYWGRGGRSEYSNGFSFTDNGVQGKGTSIILRDTTYTWHAWG